VPDRRRYRLCRIGTHITYGDRGSTGSEPARNQGDERHCGTVQVPCVS
jgi:hypothetical protein